MHLCINEPAMTDKIKINYSKVELVDPHDLGSIKHEIVRESLKLLQLSKPLEISSMSDIAGGTGLGSSSSYTVGLLNGLNALVRRHVTVQELAEEACRVEIDLIGKPIGKQDQYAAAFGGILILEIDRQGVVAAKPLELDSELIDELEHSLLLFSTNMTRDANEILSEQQQAISKPSCSLESMHKIKDIGYRIRDALVYGDICSLGALFHQHWLEKRRITSKMSTPEIDRWYELARNHGAFGGKIMGAGGGGFFVFCCPYSKRKQVRAVLEHAGLKYMPCAFDFEGSKIIGNF
jgi:D-glycero-alpha-D-manno-heptose-7-phosphate kinase